MELRKDEKELIELYESLNADTKKRLLDFAKFCSIYHPKNLIENETLIQKHSEKAKRKPRNK